jgi:ComF family protein
MVYQQEVFPLIHRMKYGPRPSLAGFCGHLMANSFGAELGELNLDGIIPIPLHSKRLRQRGFNQASLMAKPIADRLGIPVRHGILERSRWTQPQVGLTRNQREGNVRRAFRVRDPDGVAGRRWLLLDDVYTTGSTLRETALVLKKNGASEVHVIVFARVL